MHSYCFLVARKNCFAAQVMITYASTQARNAYRQNVAHIECRKTSVGGDSAEQSIGAEQSQPATVSQTQGRHLMTPRASIHARASKSS